MRPHGRAVLTSPVRLPGKRERAQAIPVALAGGGAALGLAVLLGTAALGLPILAPAAALALLAVPLLVTRPVACLLFATIIEAGNFAGVAAANGLPLGGSAVLALAVLAALVAWCRGQLTPGWSPMIVVGLVYLAFQCVAALGAPHVDLALASVADTAKSLLWPVVLGMLLLIPGRTPERVARAFALTLTLFAGMTL